MNHSFHRQRPLAGPCARVAVQTLVIAGFLICAILPASAQGQATKDVDSGEGASPPESETVAILRAVNTSREDVSKAWGRYLFRGLADAAMQEGVRLCSDTTVTPPCGGEALSAAPELRWKIAPQVSAQHALVLVRVPLTLEIVSGPRQESGNHDPGAGLFVIEDNLVVTTESADGDRDRVLMGRAASVVAQHSGVRNWFAEARTSVPPAARVAAQPASLPATDATPGSDGEGIAGGPQAEGGQPSGVTLQFREDRILDLLIDGRFAEAREEADLLLAEEDLDQARRDRVQRLRATAASREASMRKADASAVDAPEDDAPAAQAGDGDGAAQADQVAEPPPPPFDYTFRVRMAPQDGGFLRGVDGRLRIHDGGVRFVPAEGGAEKGWSIPWSQIADWGEAPGLWDVSHPLVLTRSSGESRYFVEIDQRGRFTSGTGILRLLAKGAERARSAGGGGP